MLYKYTKVKFRSRDADTKFFDIVANVLQGDTLASYMSLICRDYVLSMSIDQMKENVFILRKARSRR